MPIEAKEHLSAEAISKMKNLRLLKINNVKPPQGLNRGLVQLPQGLSYLSNELCAIDWHGYPLKSILTSFQPNKLVELRMHCSGIKKLWKGIMVRFLLMQMCISFIFIRALVCIIIYWFITDFKRGKTH